MSREHDPARAASPPAAPADRPRIGERSAGPAGLGREAPPKAGVLGALAARARASPHDPWLFYRDGWDWHWRSFSQVADQVARGAEVLRREVPGPERRVAFAARQDPDAITTGLAEQLPALTGRPIVCAVPDLDLLNAQVLEAWTLLSGAAWVLEPLADAFVPTVLWARPTLIFAGAGELRQLAERMKTRKHRRRQRLAGIVLRGEQELDPADRALFQDFGASIVPAEPEARRPRVTDSSATPRYR